MGCIRLRCSIHNIHDGLGSSFYKMDFLGVGGFDMSGWEFHVYDTPVCNYLFDSIIANLRTFQDTQ